MDFFGVPLAGSEEGAKTDLPGGGEHAIRLRRRMFREGRPSWGRLHFGLHFGIVVGAQFATIPLLSRPGDQNSLTKRGLKKAPEMVQKIPPPPLPDGNGVSPPPPPPPYPLPRQSHPGAPPEQSLCLSCVQSLCASFVQSLC